METNKTQPALPVSPAPLGKAHDPPIGRSMYLAVKEAIAAAAEHLTGAQAESIAGPKGSTTDLSASSNDVPALLSRISALESNLAAAKSFLEARGRAVSNGTLPAWLSGQPHAETPADAELAQKLAEVQSRLVVADKEVEAERARADRAELRLDVSMSLAKEAHRELAETRLALEKAKRETEMTNKRVEAEAKQSKAVVEGLWGEVGRLREEFADFQFNCGMNHGPTPSKPRPPIPSHGSPITTSPAFVTAATQTTTLDLSTLATITDPVSTASTTTQTLPPPTAAQPAASKPAAGRAISEVSSAAPRSAQAAVRGAGVRHSSTPTTTTQRNSPPTDPNGTTRPASSASGKPRGLDDSNGHVLPKPPKSPTLGPNSSVPAPAPAVSGERGAAEKKSKSAGGKGKGKGKKKGGTTF